MPREEKQEREASIVGRRKIDMTINIEYEADEKLGLRLREDNY